MILELGFDPRLSDTQTEAEMGRSGAVCLYAVVGGFFLHRGAVVWALLVLFLFFKSLNEIRLVGDGL